MSVALKKLLPALGLAAAMAAGTASADPIMNWDYTVSSSFSVASGATTFSSASGCQNVAANAISWGIGSPGCADGPGAGRSGIGITNSPTAGTMVTNGSAQMANTYTHTNNPVSSTYGTLTKATINATLGLRVAGSGMDYTYYDATYTVLFNESLNQEPCLVDSPTPCNDIWVLQGSLNKSFTIGDDMYFFSFFAEPALTSLPENVCTATGASWPCLGFTTVEGGDNAVNFMLRITSQPVTIEVPEPSSLALFGAGLLGVAALRRRRS